MHSMIIYVVFFGACMRCSRLCPLKPGVLQRPGPPRCPARPPGGVARPYPARGPCSAARPPGTWPLLGNAAPGAARPQRSAPLGTCPLPLAARGTCPWWHGALAPHGSAAPARALAAARSSQLARHVLARAALARATFKFQYEQF
jgi:hypothetical protein